LKHNAARDGVHPSLDKAVESTIGADLEDYKLNFSNVTGIKITHKEMNSPSYPFIMINQATEPVTIFVSGPFTNLALALQLDPAIKDKISAVYFMGGAVDVPGNKTGLMPDSGNRVADWNMIADPQAAKEVFESGLELYMVPLDATNKVLFSQKDILP
jgi:inosine-uridine nucleoside N-ribohydrolase